MRDTYTGTAAALRDALRHCVERGGSSALGVLHQGVPSAATLTGTDGTTQAGRIRRQLDHLAAVPRALLIVAYAPRDVVCDCRAPCCSGRYAMLRDRTSQGNNADQLGLMYEYDLSKATNLYGALSFLRNRNEASYTLAGAANAGLPLAYPGANARGVQVGIVHRF